MTNMMKTTALIIATLSIVPKLSLADGSFSAPAGNHMSYDDAEAYCKTNGGHLPSIREMATYAASQGAAGIKESSLPAYAVSEPAVKAEIIQMASQGFRMVQKKDLWKPAVDFYYSQANFQEVQPAGDAKLWTSSTDSSSSSLLGGILSPIGGNEQKFTISSLDGSLGEDTAKSGRNAVICATENLNTPTQVAPGSGTTVVTINPAQIDFSVSGDTMIATILDSNAKKVETVALDTSNLGKNAKTVQNSRDYCADVAGKAASANKNLRLDLSYQKPEKFCSISDEQTYPVSLSNAN
jgi:hypothetical protein